MAEPQNRSLVQSLTGWLSQAQNLLALIIAVAGLLTQLLGNVPVLKGWLPWVGLTLAVAAILWLIVSAYRSWVRSAPTVPEPTSASILIRGPKPFEDGDRLLGRAREISELFTIVRALDFRFGYLSGQAGAGKTSLLRAGLTARLRSELPAWTFVYVSRAGLRPDLEILRILKARFPETLAVETRLSDACARLLPTLKAPVLIAADQFEEFFLSARTAASREAVVAEFRLLWGLSREDGLLRVLFCLRKEFVDDLLSMAETLPELRIQDSRCALANIAVDTAERMIDELVAAGEINLAPQLRRRICADLAHDDLVRPVEFQIVLSRIVEQRIREYPAYEARGGAAGILSRYIAETLDPPDRPASEIDRQVGRHLLRALCADNFAARRPRGLTLAELAERVQEQMGAGEGGSALSGVAIASSAHRLVGEFKRARVLIDDDEDHVNLAHDYLAVAIRDATADIETAEERANRLLDQYMGQARVTPATVLPWRVLRHVRRYASPEQKERTEARKLIRRSQRRYWAAGLAFAVLLLSLVTIVLPFGWQTQVVSRETLNDVSVVSYDPPVAMESGAKNNRLYRLDTGETLAVLSKGQLATHPNARFMLMAQADGSVLSFEAQNGYKPRLLLRGSGWTGETVDSSWATFSPDGRRAVVLTAGGQIYLVFERQRPRLIAQVAIGQAPMTIVHSRASGRPPEEVMRPSLPSMTLSMHGRWLAVAHRENRSIYILDTDRHYETLPPPVGPADTFGRLNNVVFSDDGSYVAWIEDETVWVRVPDGRVIRVRGPAFDTFEGPGQLAFSPDGRWLVVRYGGGEFFQWRMGSPPVLARASGEEGQDDGMGSDKWTGLEFHPKAPWVMGSSRLGMMYLWNLDQPPGAHGQPLLPEEGLFFEKNYQMGTFCSDGRSAILAGANGGLFKFELGPRPKLRPSGRLAVGTVTFVTADPADFVVAYNEAEVGFGPCTMGEMVTQRFVSAVKEVMVSADQRELLVMEEDGLSRIRRSFLVWGLPIRTMKFPPLRLDGQDQRK